jgi:hypothetical protein
VRDLVAGHLAGLVDADRLEANGEHHLAPLLVVVAALARLAEMVLLQMRHFVRQGRQDRAGRALLERRGIERDLIGE